MLTLKDIKFGEQVKVVKVHGEGMTRKHILDMGISKNTLVRMIKAAPLGDPIEISVRGYNLSLRKEEAQNIEVVYE